MKPILARRASDLSPFRFDWLETRKIFSRLIRIPPCSSVTGLLGIIATLLLGGFCRAAEPAVDFLKAKPEAIEAWKDMRFGLFICWGPVSLTGREIGWSRGNPTPIEEYDALYKQWNPEKFNAREWAKVVKESGARYVVYLLKHHDGFCLWDTKQTDFNIMHGPFKRDITREFADACRKLGIGFFPYYSTCDWHHPDFPVTSPGGKVKRPVSNLDRYNDYLEAQVQELVTGYGPLVGIWFDVPQGFDRARGERVIRFARSLQPNLLVNNRTGAPGDFDTPEQTVGRFQNTRPWESCITLGTQWSWKPNDALKPYTHALRILVACAIGDGNLALNTNPMPDGQIEPRQIESFRKIGAWLQQYGESIYGTRGGPFVAQGSVAVRTRGDQFPLPSGPWWGGSTHKDRAIYLHLLRWPSNTVTLPPIQPRIVKHTVLTGGEATVRQSDSGIEIAVPEAQRDAIDTIVKLELDAPAHTIPTFVPPPILTSSLTTGKKATASNWYQKSDSYAPDKAVDGDPNTRWGCDYGTHACWLEIDLGAPQTFDHAAISEPYGRVQEFLLEVWQNDAWKTFHRGTTIGEDLQVTFAPVTGQRVRLNLLKTTDGPSIWEFQLTDSKAAPKSPSPNTASTHTSSRIEMPGQWPTAKAIAWYAEQSWLVGCNFLPSTAVNDVEMWQAETFDAATIKRELGWAHDLGFNTVRVFLNFVLWEADSSGLKTRFDRFLAIADQCGIRAMPVLFDDCNFAGRVADVGKQPAPVPGVHNSQWVSSPPLAMVTNQAAWPQLERYVKEIVGAFANDRRIVLWDLYNEPGASGMNTQSQPLLEAAFAWAREIRPTQPLTVGAWADFNTPFSRRMMESSDIVSFHGYDALAGLEQKLKICGEYGRPILCTEWLRRRSGNDFETLLALFRDRHIGCYSWGLVAGRTQTYYPWGSPKGAPEPKQWQHDIFRNDGTPYVPREIELIRSVTGKSSSPPPAGKPKGALSL
jgi:alpha-L-fucosidase